jgi:CDP-diacylglycerol pyrophosphatase
MQKMGLIKKLMMLLRGYLRRRRFHWKQVQIQLRDIAMRQRRIETMVLNQEASLRRLERKMNNVQDQVK